MPSRATTLQLGTGSLVAARGTESPIGVVNPAGNNLPLRGYLAAAARAHQDWRQSAAAGWHGQACGAATVVRDPPHPPSVKPANKHDCPGGVEEDALCTDRPVSAAMAAGAQLPHLQHDRERAASMIADAR